MWIWRWWWCWRWFVMRTLNNQRNVLRIELLVSSSSRNWGTATHRKLKLRHQISIEWWSRDLPIFYSTAMNITQREQSFHSVSQWAKCIKLKQKKKKNAIESYQLRFMVFCRQKKNSKLNSIKCRNMAPWWRLNE